VIALLGVDAQTGVFMLLYLDLAYEAARQSGRLRNVADLRQAVIDGAAKRMRLKFYDRVHNDRLFSLTP
jgi:Cu(I)/Ag(I) efflux system membrane protein CusA/SilA